MENSNLDKHLSVGFIGLGKMGTPMAINLLRAGISLIVWNRSIEKSKVLESSGAQLASSVAELFASTSIILVMLLDEQAIDTVLERGTPGFNALVSGKTLVNLGTTSAEYSHGLEQDLLGAAGYYVEAPVSGSSVPAERGELVGMVAGNSLSVAAARPLLEPLCSKVFSCGLVPSAVRTKLAVNHFLISMVAALGETVTSAKAAGVDLSVLQEVLDAGPMASDVSRLKLGKLIRGDFSPQASVRDAGKIARLVFAQTLAAGARAPLMECCLELYRSAEETGWQDLDMIAATRTLHKRT
ncbi:MAG: NAD(P)-dependent oxidoreductase [Arenimonas sp.]